MTWYQRICPHIFGWSYNTYRARRFCRACAHQQHIPAPFTLPNYDAIQAAMHSGDILKAQRMILADLDGKQYVDA